MGVKYSWFQQHKDSVFLKILDCSPNSVHLEQNCTWTNSPNAVDRRQETEDRKKWDNVEHPTANLELFRTTVAVNPTLGYTPSIAPTAQWLFRVKSHTRSPVSTDRMTLKRRQLGPARTLSGKERRWLDPDKGLLKVLERRIDVLASRYIYPRMFGVWNPYCWLLRKRFSLAEAAIAPPRWPKSLLPLKILLISDVHTGIFLKPAVLREIVEALMAVEPDMVAIAGDIVTGRTADLDGFLPALAPLSKAPLGAWYCYGNHDYFGGDPQGIRQRLSAIGINTLNNESTHVKHGSATFVLGGIDDLLLGKPDWDQLLAMNGPPHLLLAHHPDFFYQAEARNVALVLSGHTHGGQIRPPWTPPLVRQSKYCLDEGAYAYNSSRLIVSRGLGSVGLPLRYGADPEAVLIHVKSP